MKKSIALIMALSVLVCGVFAACSSKKTDGQNSAADTTRAGLANADTEFGTEINKDGKEVDVVYEKDKKGKTVAYEIDKNGEKVQKTVWHSIVAYKKLAETCGQYLKKGSQIFVDGRINYQEWEKDGVKHNRTLIVMDKLEMLGTKPKEDGTPMEDVPF